jgi:hypothetical protein
VWLLAYPRGGLDALAQACLWKGPAILGWRAT